MSPEDVCTRTLCQYDPELECYQVEGWGETYSVHPGNGQIKPQRDEAHPPGNGFGLAIVFYLLRAKNMDISGEWISEKDLPNGVTFFRGPHALPVHLITEKFGQDPDGFRKACKNLQGTPLDMADAASSFLILPRLPVAVLFWAADSEFDAEARILFDRTISSHLPLDVIFGLSMEICGRINGMGNI